MEQSVDNSVNEFVENLRQHKTLKLNFIFQLDRDEIKMKNAHSTFC